MIKDRINIGFVHFKPVNEGAVYHVLNRTEKTVADRANLRLLYTGTLETNIFGQRNIKCRHFRSGSITKRTFLTILLSPYLIFQVYFFCREYNLQRVLNLFDHYSFWIVALGARLAGTKPIMRVVGKAPRGYSSSWRQRLWHAIGDCFERLSLSLSWRVLTVSEALADAIDPSRVARDKIFIISQGVDTSHFLPREDKANLAFPKNILFIGRLVKNKRLDLLQTVLNRLRKQGYDVRLKICGTGPLESKFRNQSKSVHWISFLGYVPFENLPEVYRISDLLVLPSMSEGLPNAVLEAFSSCVPVIASAVGGIPELLGSDRGIMASPGDESQFEAAIRKMLNNAQMRIDRARNGRDYVVNNHSLEVIRQRFIKAISCE